MLVNMNGHSLSFARVIDGIPMHSLQKNPVLLLESQPIRNSRKFRLMRNLFSLTLQAW